MSPKFHAQILNNRLPSRIGCALLLLSLLAYVIAGLEPILTSGTSLPLSHWPQILGSLLLLLVCGMPAGQYAWRGSLS